MFRVVAIAVVMDAVADVGVAKVKSIGEESARMRAYRGAGGQARWRGINIRRGQR